MPPPRRGSGGIKRWSASVVRPSVRLSVCLMSRTSALTRKPKGLGRRNYAQGYPRSHATPTPTSRSKVKSQGGAGAYCGGHLAAQLVNFVILLVFIVCMLSILFILLYLLPLDGDHRSGLSFLRHSCCIWAKLSWTFCDPPIEGPVGDRSALEDRIRWWSINPAEGHVRVALASVFCR